MLEQKAVGGWKNRVWFLLEKYYNNICLPRILSSISTKKQRTKRREGRMTAHRR